MKGNDLEARCIGYTLRPPNRRCCLCRRYNKKGICFPAYAERDETGFPTNVEVYICKGCFMKMVKLFTKDLKEVEI